MAQRKRPGGANIVAAIQLLNQKVKNAVGDHPRGQWSTEELRKGMDLLSDILDAEVRRLKVKQREDAETRKSKTAKGDS